ncbi:MAG: hypothetical protein R3C45_13250 [Phycisphaerales bacterium]
MTHSGGSPFNLSVDIGATPGLTITGHKIGGGTVSTITALTVAFTTEVLTNFTNLLSVDFQATQGIANNNTFWLDNLVVSTVLTGDLNGDGFVGIADLNIVLGAWNENVPPGNPLADPSGMVCWHTATRMLTWAPERRDAPGCKCSSSRTRYCRLRMCLHFDLVVSQDKDTPNRISL